MPEEQLLEAAPWSDLYQSAAHVDACREELAQFSSDVLEQLDVLAAELAQRQHAWAVEREEAERELQRRCEALDRRQAELDDAWERLETVRGELTAARRELDCQRDGVAGSHDASLDELGEIRRLVESLVRHSAEVASARPASSSVAEEVRPSPPPPTPRPVREPDEVDETVDPVVNSMRAQFESLQRDSNRARRKR